jgi:arsenate reductase
MLYPTIETLRSKFNFESIDATRKNELNAMINYIKSKVVKNETALLNFICTHNSRRSQLSQVWAQVAAHYYGIKANCYSGGVEVTAFNERAVESLKRMGFLIEARGENNPSYFVSFSKDAIPIVAFSKTYDNSINPKSGFAAIMTCSHADENCPFIVGCEARIPVRYEDPKAFDDTPQEAEKYDERSLQIATEMFYVFSKTK